MIKDLLVDILGSYEPVMTDVFDSAGQVVGQVVAAGFAGVDWVYVGACFMLAVCVYCVFRIVGGVIIK